MLIVLMAPQTRLRQGRIARHAKSGAVLPPKSSLKPGLSFKAFLLQEALFDNESGSAALIDLGVTALCSWAGAENTCLVYASS